MGAVQEPQEQEQDQTTQPQETQDAPPASAPEVVDPKGSTPEGSAETKPLNPNIKGTHKHSFPAGPRGVRGEAPVNPMKVFEDQKAGAGAGAGAGGGGKPLVGGAKGPAPAPPRV